MPPEPLYEVAVETATVVMVVAATSATVAVAPALELTAAEETIAAVEAVPF